MVWIFDVFLKPAYSQSAMDYRNLCIIYETIEKTPSRLDKTRIAADFIKTADSELPKIMLLLQGRIYPTWDDRVIGLSTQLVIKCIALAASVPPQTVEETWKDRGDLGSCAEQLIKKKQQVLLFQQKLSIDKVYKSLQKLATFEGHNSTERKVSTVAELLSQAEPIEARYLIRLILEELRIGLGEGVLRDALVWAFLPGIKGINAEQSGNLDLTKYTTSTTNTERDVYNYFIEQVQHALDMCNDFSIVAAKLKESGLKGLQTLQLKPGIPVQSMLALREKDIEGAFKRVGKPAALEYKCDGFRVQAHKTDKCIKLFTRRLENITHQFPDVVELLNNVNAASYILDCEVIGIDTATKRALPFQNISQRIKRRYDIAEIIKQLPVAVYVFDILYYEDQSLINNPFIERRALIEKCVKPTERINPIPQIITDSSDKAKQFYEQSLAAGNEGIMFKKIDASYQPGSRVGTMVKMKPILETLDLVIIGAEWGDGKRSKWLSSYIVACRKDDELLELGRVSTGLKEKKDEGLSFEEVSQLLEPLILKKNGKLVEIKPQIVLEVAFEEIQKSPHYGSGYALRFPRIVRLRTDRNAQSCSTMDDVERILKEQ